MADQSNPVLVCTMFWPGSMARLAQSAERKALNLVVVDSSPTVGVCFIAGLEQVLVTSPEKEGRRQTWNRLQTVC